MTVIRSASLALMLSSLPVIAQAEEAAHGAEASGGLPQFDPTWYASQVFWLVIAFAIMLTVFSKIILPKLSGTLEDRRKHIDSDMRMAEQLAVEAESLKTSYEESVRKAAEEAGKIVRQVEDTSKERTNQYLSEFRTKYEQHVQSTEKEIESASHKAMQDMNKIAAEIAAEAAQKIVGISTDLSQAQTVVASLQNKPKAA